MTLINRLHKAANECEDENGVRVNAWGNLMTEATEEIVAWTARCMRAEDQVAASMLRGIKTRLENEI